MVITKVGLISPYILIPGIIFLAVATRKGKTDRRVFEDPTEPGSYKNMDPAFLRAWDRAVKQLGFVPIVTSGYRTWLKNMQVGGLPNSLHMKGRAADIANYDQDTNYRIMQAFSYAGFDVVPEGDHIHVELEY